MKGILKIIFRKINYLWFFFEVIIYKKLLELKKLKLCCIFLSPTPLSYAIISRFQYNLFFENKSILFNYIFILWKLYFYLRCEKRYSKSPKCSCSWVGKVCSSYLHCRKRKDNVKLLILSLKYYATVWERKNHLNSPFRERKEL